MEKDAYAELQGAATILEAQDLQDVINVFETPEVPKKLTRRTILQELHNLFVSSGKY